MKKKERFLQINYKCVKEDLTSTLNKAKESDDYGVYFYTDISLYSSQLSYLIIALNENFNEGKRYAYISALAYDIEMKKYGWAIVHGFLPFPYRVFCELEILYSAFLTNNHKLIKSIIFEMAESDKDTIKKNIDEFYYNIYNVIKCIYTNDNESLEVYINKLEAFRKRNDMKDYMHYVDGLEAIIEKNEDKLIRALISMNEVHENLEEYCDTLNETICMPALGIGKLAMFKGMKVICNDIDIPLFNEFMNDTDEINEHIEYLKYSK
ncbi:MAG: hypothetical protein E7207_00820 [Clostridium butyricum]|nr:hypothetical protein [Clostridium butyricum]